MSRPHYNDLYWEYRELHPGGNAGEGNKKGSKYTGKGEHKPPHHGGSPTTSPVYRYPGAYWRDPAHVGPRGTTSANPRQQSVSFNIPSPPLRLPIDAVAEPRPSTVDNADVNNPPSTYPGVKIKNTFVNVGDDTPGCPRRQTSPPGLLHDLYVDSARADSTMRHGDYSGSGSRSWHRRLYPGNSLRHSDYDGSASRSAHFFGESPAFFGPSPAGFGGTSPAFFGTSPDGLNTVHPDFFPLGTSASHRGTLPQVPEGDVPTHLAPHAIDYDTHHMTYPYVGYHQDAPWGPQYGLSDYYGTAYFHGYTPYGLPEEPAASSHNEYAFAPPSVHHSQNGSLNNAAQPWPEHHAHDNYTDHTQSWSEHNAQDNYHNDHAPSWSEHHEGDNYHGHAQSWPERNAQDNYHYHAQSRPEHNDNDNHARSSQSNPRGKPAKRKPRKDARVESQSGSRTWSAPDTCPTVITWPAARLWSATKTWSASAQQAWWRPLSTKHRAADSVNSDAPSLEQRHAKNYDAWTEDWQEFAPWKRFKSAGARRRYWRDVKVMRKKMEEKKKRETEKEMDGKEKGEAEKDMKKAKDPEAEREMEGKEKGEVEKDMKKTKDPEAEKENGEKEKREVDEDTKKTMEREVEEDKSPSDAG
eukprot:GEMP01023251.1.p1 GENE.GEMP01023251.1~~GEMP01023251.1.p1  ORF type:complete len:637 (+),score=164.91 GEMP01023251.1:272-2182(+)